MQTGHITRHRDRLAWALYAFLLSASVGCKAPPRVVEPPSAERVVVGEDVADDEVASAAEVTRYSWERETIGELRLGMSAPEVRALLGPPSAAEGPTLSEATGGLLLTWTYPNEGVFLSFEQASTNAESPSVLVSVRILAPSKATTSLRVGIGASFSEALAAYADVNDPDQEGDGLVDEYGNIVVGSIYGGLYFRIEDGRVAQMFLGSAAE